MFIERDNIGESWKFEGTILFKDGNYFLSQGNRKAGLFFNGIGFYEGSDVLVEGKFDVVENEDETRVMDYRIENAEPVEVYDRY